MLNFISNRTRECIKNAWLEWDALTCFTRAGNQTQASFEEQKLPISNCTDAINAHTDLYSNSNFNKFRVTHGAPGSGKSFVIQYTLLYAILRGLNVQCTEMMARCVNQLGGIHVHQLFCLEVNNGLSPHRMAELSIIKLLQDPVKLNIIQTMEVLFFDEAGQKSAELLSVLDFILLKVRDNNIFLGGLLILSTMDHSQLSPVKRRPF